MPLRSARPLVSCIMPTYNRRDFARMAFEYFLRQDYARRELIIIDDGSDAVSDLVPCDSRFRYIHIGAKATVGAKRNLACEQARGDIIAHWDDDDWSSPQRLSYQVGALLREKAELCGLNPVLFFDVRSGEAWKYCYPPQDSFWVHGNSLCYRRSFWERNHFGDLNVGEDNQFIWNAPPARMVALSDATCVLGIIHDQNISANPGGGYWQPYQAEKIRRVLGDDWKYYERGIVAAQAPPVREILEDVLPVYDVPPQEISPPSAIAPYPSPHPALPAGIIADCLGRAEIEVPDRPIRAERCIATIISTAGAVKGYPFPKNYLQYLDDLLGSLAANADLRDAKLVVFVAGDEPEAEDIARKYAATVIRCRTRAKVNATLKSVMYSIPMVVDAQYFLCMDADMLVVGDLKPIFSTLEALPENTILAVPELNHIEPMTLRDALQQIYYATETDLARILGTVNQEADYPVVVNDGLFAGSRKALLALDECIRSMPGAIEWTDERDDVWWRNQFVFNLALARLGSGCFLDHSYNLQLHYQEAEVHCGPGGVRAYWRERPVKVLHRNGIGRDRYPKLAGYYARVAEPLVGEGGGDSYTQFLRTLRAWIGRHGMHAMAWSFYGTADTYSGRVRDPDTMPLLGLLHYLIRSSGCTRVLEAGTGRGVSTACMAAAVAHRNGGRVVTLDPNLFPEREDLWSGLPSAVRSVIEVRAVDSVEGMTAAWDAGERYDAALLDTLHTEEQVWAEFEWARRLVSTGGLILIHDVRWVAGTVEKALCRIQAQGYNVTRLWTGEHSVCEDDHLGLAVIENRCYRDPPFNGGPPR